ncbi:MAG: hypothetical protein OJF47_004217 [Nitrospira sp.]|nr:MAG: hypothetical protein OJF47_004217 [Nitrospira sp.]
MPYGEPLSDARTPLADYFRILLRRHLLAWEITPAANGSLRRSDDSEKDGQGAVDADHHLVIE